MPRVVLQPDADRPPVLVRLVCRPAGCCGKPTHEASTAERSFDSAGLCPSHARMAARLLVFLSTIPIFTDCASALFAYAVSCTYSHLGDGGDGGDGGGGDGCEPSLES